MPKRKPYPHPIKPKSYIQINNFYTPTVYEKGAEIIRILQTLIGKENYYKGIEKYFELYDGQAVTTEDFLHAMQVASGKDLSQFSRWYDQAGTPQLTFSWNYDAGNRIFTLNITQNQEPPLHVPLAISLLGEKGKPLLQTTLELTEAKQEFSFPRSIILPSPR